jgi:CBS-domain-containing membrane protein
MRFNEEDIDDMLEAVETLNAQAEDIARLTAEVERLKQALETSQRDFIARVVEPELPKTVNEDDPKRGDR